MTYEEENAAFEQGVKLGAEIAMISTSRTVYKHGESAARHPELFLGHCRKDLYDSLAMREIGLQAMDVM